MTDLCLTCDNLSLGDNRQPAAHDMNFGVRRGSLKATVGGDGSRGSSLIKGRASVARWGLGVGHAREIRERRSAVTIVSENISDARVVEHRASGAGASVSGIVSSYPQSAADEPAPASKVIMRYSVSPQHL